MKIKFGSAVETENVIFAVSEIDLNKPGVGI